MQRNDGPDYLEKVGFLQVKWISRDRANNFMTWFCIVHGKIDQMSWDHNPQEGVARMGLWYQ